MFFQVGELRFESPLNICCLRLAGNSERLLEFLLEISPRTSRLVKQPVLMKSDTPLRLDDMMSEHSEKLVVDQVGFLGERSTRTYLFNTPVKEKKKTFCIVCLSERESKAKILLSCSTGVKCSCSGEKVFHLLRLVEVSAPHPPPAAPVGIPSGHARLKPSPVWCADVIRQQDVWRRKLILVPCSRGSFVAGWGGVGGVGV